jgi:hypothetical protein
MVFLGCFQDPLDDPDPVAPPTYPGGVTADCHHLPHLCGLPMADLGGGQAPGAMHIAFLGDGFLPHEMPLFAAQAEAWAEGLRAHPDGFVGFAPDLFHFWRVDLPSNTGEVNDGDVLDTPLMAHNSPSDTACGGVGFIEADDARMELAVRAADRRVRVIPDAIVVVVKDSEGRANATPGRHVRISSRDGLDVLRHELGHALFWLGDEYVEFSSCPTSNDIHPRCTEHGPAPDSTEADLLMHPNLSRSDDGAKWLGAVEGSAEGGGRWPCFFHPEHSCLMDGDDSGFCPVCENAIREILRLRVCDSDGLAPRVAIAEEVQLNPSGSALTFGAVAFDERNVREIHWSLNGQELGEVGPFLNVPLGTLKKGDLLRAHAEDEAGHLGTSPPRRIDEDVPLPSLRFPILRPRNDGHIQELSVDARPPGGRLMARWKGKVVLDVPIQGRLKNTRPGQWVSLDAFLPIWGAADELEIFATSADGRARSAPLPLPISPPLAPALEARLGEQLQVGSRPAFIASDAEFSWRLTHRVLDRLDLGIPITGCAAVEKIVVRADGRIVGQRAAPFGLPCHASLGIFTLRVPLVFPRGLSWVETLSVDIQTFGGGSVHRTYGGAFQVLSRDDCPGISLFLDGESQWPRVHGALDPILFRSLSSSTQVLGLAADSQAHFSRPVLTEMDARILPLDLGPASGADHGGVISVSGSGFCQGLPTLFSEDHEVRWDVRPPGAYVLPHFKSGHALDVQVLGDFSGEDIVAVRPDGTDIPFFGLGRLQVDPAWGEIEIRDGSGNRIQVPLLAESFPDHAQEHLRCGGEK